MLTKLDTQGSDKHIADKHQKLMKISRTFNLYSPEERLYSERVEFEKGYGVEGKQNTELEK